MDFVQWYGIALTALAAIVLAASHLRPLLPFWLLRKIAYPRLHPLLGGTSDTTRFGAIVVGVFLTGNVLCSSLGVKSSPDLVKRTGQLFTINAIPLFLGGKIGPLVNILRIQYEDFARAHRWLARVAAAQAIVHAAVAASAKKDFRSQSQIAGLAAVSAVCAILLFSMGVVRRRRYELFAKLHLALAVLAVVATWLHVASGSVFRPPEVYLLAACCTYGSTFAVWFMHILYRNYSYRALFASARIFKTRASSTQVVRLELKLPRPCAFRPGQFVYVRMLTLGHLAILQSHPFYVYSWDEDILSLLVERKTGFTAGLLAEDAPSPQPRTVPEAEGTVVRVMVEGPFGKSVDLSSYHTIALFATGIGIVTQLSHVRRWLKDHQGSFQVTTQSINLFWEVEAEAHKHWAEDAMNDLLSMDLNFMVRIHVFVKSDYTSSNRKTGDTVTPTKINTSQPARVHYNYYPIDAEAQVRDQLEKANGKTVIAVCSDSLTTASIRRETLLANSPYIEEQWPSLLVLIGSTCKARAIQELVSAKSVTPTRAHGEVHLHLDPSSAFSNRPIYVADSDIPERHRRGKILPVDACHETISHSFRQTEKQPLDASSAAGQVYAQLLHPFADVFCLFAADLGGLREISRQVARWLEKPQASLLPTETYPSLIIVTEGNTRADEKAFKDWFLQNLAADTPRSLSDRFSGLDVVTLSQVGTMSNGARHRPLRDRLMRVSDRIRKHRADSRTLFSARHFHAFFRLACQHLTGGNSEPFDFVTAARLHNPVPSDLKQHLSNFVRLVKSPRELIDFAAPMIASSLFLDSYPPDAPMFDPGSVFERLYKGVCHEASRSALSTEQDPSFVLPSTIVKLIQSHFQRRFSDALQSNTSTFAAESHKGVLQRACGFWLKLQSRETCLVCLGRRPHIGLPCGHTVCENCICVFGRASEEDPCVYHVDRCFLCELDAKHKSVRIHPPTAGAGVLSMDGGGVRGILELVFLQLLEDRIGLPMPLLRNFKVVFGTSTGGIIALGLAQGWSIQKCIKTFPQLANAAFQRRKFLGLLHLPKALEPLMSIFTDCLYPAGHIETALKEAYGCVQGLLEMSQAISLGTRVGIPVATVRGPSLCLFTSYNGTHKDDTEYHIIESHDGAEQPRVWEVARAASAAPLFFKPTTIRGYADQQDAGQLRNNPILMALSEAQKLFPGTEEPDFVVSLGTGGPRLNAQELYIPGSRGLLKDGWIPRFCRGSLAAMAGDRDWKALVSFGRPKSSGKYHRLDIEFDGPEPRLDAVSDMASLQSRALGDPLLSPVLDNIAECAIASLFYFKPHTRPRYMGGQYVGSGWIKCKLRHGEPALEVLLSRLCTAGARLLIGNRNVPDLHDKCIAKIGDCSNFDETRNFCTSLTFGVQGSFSIFLQEDSNTPRHISGSPFSVERLVRAEGLEAYFGRADHRKRDWAHDDCAIPEAKRRRSS
ncbi:Patatin [Pyrenophora tritici-repentis]|nr:Patatin [Pyrenophora tritici-repentis]